MMNFVVIGKMAEKLTKGLKRTMDPQMDHFKIRGFRNIIAHNYFGIDAGEVWQSTQRRHRAHRVSAQE